MIRIRVVSHFDHLIHKHRLRRHLTREHLSILIDKNHQRYLILAATLQIDQAFGRRYSSEQQNLFASIQLNDVKLILFNEFSLRVYEVRARSDHRAFFINHLCVKHKQRTGYYAQVVYLRYQSVIFPVFLPTDEAFVCTC